MNNKRVYLGAMLALSATFAVRAECSRPLTVPVAPIGQSVTVTGGVIGGIYPELLRALASKEGCEINFSAVPRARQAAMFETGRADLLVPATRTPQRDQHGVFVPLVTTRAMLISLDTDTPRSPLLTLVNLLERRELRVALVRGYDFGDAYQGLLKGLRQQPGRLVLAVDPVSVARMLAAGIADVTVMNPTSLIGALQTEPKLRPLIDTLRFEPVEELAWGESGIYISSKDNLPEADRQLLREALERTAKSGAVFRSFQRLFPAASLADSLRGR